MDLLDELESMADSVSQLPDDTLTGTDASRWQALFGSSGEEINQRLEEYRTSFARQRMLVDAEAQERVDG